MNTNILPQKEFIVYIEGIGTKGDGVARVENFVIICKGAQINKTYLVKIEKTFERFAIAEIIKPL